MKSFECVCVCGVCGGVVWCVCVCVCERERERETCGRLRRENGARIPNA